MTTPAKTRKPYRDIVVIGASTGGVAALMELVKGLPADFPAPIFVVMHVPADSPSLLPQLLVDCGGLLVPHPLGVCRFVAQLLQLRLRGTGIWLCNVRPELHRYLHELRLCPVFHLGEPALPAA